MSMNESAILSAKFESILELSEDQFSALKSNDIVQFRHALAAKGAVIESIVGSIASAAADPLIMSIVEKIQASEEESVRLINSRLDCVRQELAMVEQSKFASRAYGKTSRKAPSFVPTADTPMMFDHQR